MDPKELGLLVGHEVYVEAMLSVPYGDNDILPLTYMGNLKAIRWTGSDIQNLPSYLVLQDGHHVKVINWQNVICVYERGL